MKNVLFVTVALLCATTLAAQQPNFWGDNHPPDTHNHQNGNGHDGNGNDGHNGWGYGHHKDREIPTCPPPKNEECPGSAPVPEPGTLLLVGSGLAAGAIMRRRKAAKAAAAATQQV